MKFEPTGAKTACGPNVPRPEGRYRPITPKREAKATKAVVAKRPGDGLKR